MNAKDCGVTIQLKGNSYSETMNGSANVSGSVSNSYARMSGSNGFTISGDLGLSYACHAEASGPAEAEEPDSFSGECVFMDSEGTTLTISAEELQSRAL
jgi:hypothetical protein